MKKIDLHVHTTASDGLLSPSEIIGLANKRALSAVAVTDHDAVGGIDEALFAADDIPGLMVIPGIEFSIDYPTGDFHLVGLFIDHKNPALNAKTSELTLARETRGRRIVDDLNKHGYEIDFSEVEIEAAGGAIGKPHVARALVKRGYAADFKNAFTRFFAEGMPGCIKKDKVSIEEALILIREAGGISIAAHPASLELENEENYISEFRRFAGMGLGGIEVYSPMHGRRELALFKSIAEEFDLLVSGGSDYHGDKKERLGYYGESRKIPPEIIGPIFKLAGVKP